MVKPIKTALVGFGLSGKVFHAPFIHTSPKFELTKVLERHNSEAAKTYPHIITVRNFQELLDDKELELIVLGIPNIYHFEMTQASLAAGKHVIVEKPFTPTSEEAERLIKTECKSETNIYVFHNRRWDNDFLTIKNLIKKGVLGEILEYEAHFDRFSPEAVRRSPWREEADPGGGVLFDLGSHLIDQALNLFGMPDEVYAHIQYQRPMTKVDDCFEVQLYYPLLKVVLKAGVHVKEKGPRYAIHGRNGSYIKYGIDPQEEALKKGAVPGLANWGIEDPAYSGILNYMVDGNGKRETVLSIPGNYMQFFDNVYASIREGIEKEVKSEEAKNVIFIIEKAFESHREGKRITL